MASNNPSANAKHEAMNAHGQLSKAKGDLGGNDVSTFPVSPVIQTSEPDVNQNLEDALTTALDTLGSTKAIPTIPIMSNAKAPDGKVETISMHEGEGNSHELVNTDLKLAALDMAENEKKNEKKRESDKCVKDHEPHNTKHDEDEKAEDESGEEVGPDAPVVADPTVTSSGAAKKKKKKRKSKSKGVMVKPRATFRVCAHTTRLI